MNNKFIVASAFAALSGFAVLANTACAGPDIHLSIGFGGRPGPVIVAPHCDVPAPVVIVPARGYGQGNGYGQGYGYGHSEPVYRDACPPPAPRGYWTDVSVRVWVPAERVVTCDHHGRTIYAVRPGYFTYRTDRVWVAEGGRGGYGGYAHGRG